MYGKMNSACLYGIEGIMIGVEIDIASGLPLTTIIGLPDSAIREAVERVRAAVKNCGYRYPQQRITINLAPADLRKEGSAFDLAIAVGILATSGQLVIPAASEMLLIGELALDGSIRSVNGVLPMVEAARSAGFRSVLLPRGNAAEAALISGMSIYTADHLNELPEPGNSGLPTCSEFTVPRKARSSLNEEKNKCVNSVYQVDPVDLVDSAPSLLNEKAAPPVALPFPVTVMNGADARERPPALALSLEHLRYVPVVTFPRDTLPEENEMREDYSDVLGQHHVKRALTIAAAGRHNILISRYIIHLIGIT
jgi:magnesium chelatase family protein